MLLRLSALPSDVRKVCDLPRASLNVWGCAHYKGRSPKKKFRRLTVGHSRHRTSGGKPHDEQDQESGVNSGRVSDCLEGEFNRR